MRLTSLSALGIRIISLLPLLQGQTPTNPSFEFATVRPTDPRIQLIGLFVDRGGKISITNYSLKTLIQVSYNVLSFQVSGGPKWIDNTRYSITAVPPATCPCSKFIPISRKRPPPDEELLMLRQLLVDRFHLKLHEEHKKGHIFILQVAKGGPKLEDSKDKRAFPFVGFGPNLVDDQPEFVEMRGENASMSKLAARLSEELQVPVRDDTGIVGSYDFRFDYVRRLSPSPGPSLFTAIRDIGLRLTPASGTVPTLVVDHAELPTEN